LRDASGYVPKTATGREHLAEDQSHAAGISRDCLLNDFLRAVDNFRRPTLAEKCFW
jgi:hypothetical protein